MKNLTFKPVTGLDVAKLLGPEAVKDYLESKRLQEQKNREWSKICRKQRTGSKN